MRSISEYRRHKEIIVGISAILVLLIYWIAPNKTDFLNLFYIPILLAGYLMGKRYSLLGGVAAVVVIGILALVSAQSPFAGQNAIEIGLRFSTWGGFLMLAGFVTGHFNETLHHQTMHIQNLNERIRLSGAELETLHKTREDENRNFAYKTEQLLEKNVMVSHLKGRLEKTLYSIMDTNVAQLIIENRLNIERSRISVFFADLVEFNDFSDTYRPEIVINELNRIYGQIEPVIHTFKGHIDSYLADKIICEFGAPINYKLHALHSVAAAIKAQEGLRDLDQPWNLRIGIATGQAITALIGQKRNRYTAVGNLVNRAGRLQELCPPNAILVDEDTHQAVSSYVDSRMVNSFEIKRNNTRHTHIKRKINSLMQKTRKKPLDADLLFSIGTLYHAIYDMSKAKEFLGKALELDPDNSRIKNAYNEAVMKQDGHENVPMRGGSERITVYEIMRLKNPLEDRNKIPKDLFDRFKQVESVIEDLEDAILPVEVIDGSVGGSKVSALLAFAIATELDLPESRREKIAIGACLHDIGKEKIPHYLLNQEGNLSSTEFEEIMKHPLEGIMTLQIRGYDDDTILNIVKYHHEFYNGCGYPEGKRGEEIPIEARIVSVTDAYNALTSTRPYRESWEPDAALKEIERSAQQGKYDKRIVDILLRLLRQPNLV